MRLLIYIYNLLVSYGTGLNVGVYVYILTGSAL